MHVYTSVPIGNKYMPKLCFSINSLLGNGGPSDLPPEKFFEVTPTRTSENALFGKWNITVFIIDLQAKTQKLALLLSCIDI